MVTVAEEPEAPTTTKEDVQQALDTVETLGRVLLTGTEGGRVRRNFLFTVAALSIALGLAPVALVALFLLALTDTVIV